jgi:hypothetical protein
MRAKHRVVDDRRNGEIVKHVGKVLPHICVSVLADAFLIESVDLRDLTTFMIASQ